MKLYFVYIYAIELKVYILDMQNLANAKSKWQYLVFTFKLQKGEDHA